MFSWANCWIARYSNGDQIGAWLKHQVFCGAVRLSLGVLPVWWTCLRSGSVAFIVRRRNIGFKISNFTNKYVLFVLECLSGILALLIVASDLCFGKKKMLRHFYFPFNRGNGVSWLRVQSN